MALNIDLYSSSYFLELDDSTIYGIHYEGANSLSIPSAQRIYQEVWGKGYSPPSAIDYRNRSASLEIMLKGTSLDNLIVNYRQPETILLQAQEYWATKGVSGDRAFLSIQLAGMTNPIEYEILDGELGAGGIFQYIIKNTSAPKLAKIPLSLTLRPWGRPQALTRVASGSLNNGGGTGATGGTYSMAAPAGDVPAPLKVSFAAAQAERRFLLARRTVGNVANFAALWPIQCETGAFTGYTVTNIEAHGQIALSNVADATCSDGNKLRMTYTNGAGTATNEPLIRVTINDNLSDFYGRFRVLLRLADTSANWTNVSLTYGGTGADIANPSVTAVTGSDIALIDLGEMQIPARGIANDAVITSFNFQLRISFANATDTIDWDCIYLVPVDEQIVDYSVVSATSANDIQVIDRLLPQPAIYQTDSTGVVEDNARTPYRETSLEALQGKVNLFLPLVMGSAGGQWPLTLADTLTLTFDYHPQYALLR